jgi:hypothetical protein
LQKIENAISDHPSFNPPFQDIKTMRDQIVRVKGTDRVPILLVGNKAGLYSLVPTHIFSAFYFPLANVIFSPRPCQYLLR